MALNASLQERNGHQPITDTLVLPSRMDVIRIVRDRLQRHLESLGYDDRDWMGIRLSVHEALTNAIRHGNRNEAGKSLVVSYSIHPHEVQIHIADEGQGFKPSSVPDPTVDSRRHLPSGRGLWLMQHYMDSVAFNIRGNGVTLIKRRRPDGCDPTRE